MGQNLPKGITLSRMHWGGGTPTLMAPDMIEELADAVFEILPLSKGAEFSVEIDPNQIDEARLDALMRKGMTRASVGIQDFHTDIQKTIGRIQSFEITRDVIDMLRDRGIRSVNADILFGLPHQSKERIAESVQKLLSLSPDRVALYGYAHVPWMAKRQQLIPTDALPTPVQRLQLFETARRLFLWDGYREIGIDHFAKPGDGLDIAQRTGRLRRNFQGYTDDTAEALIGLGASAISKFPQGFAQNAPATADYVKRVKERRFATSRGHVFAGEDLMRSRMIEALMCDFQIDRAEILRDFNPKPGQLDALFAEVSAAFPDMLEISPAGLQIKKKGQALTRMIARTFDAYNLSKAGHSPAM
ncbi:oxygen-independent coproporphyrinogen III oxidase [Actibacterium pelagium]|uniref:Oxygen-independent coproporphyrinogen III oxidase n=1 Tax=Actibacterium pelagium TaxID=2029103 RepID=A0A917AG94_9RHOB|nr:oxygen-independent coproporphyrinogen III oxidase [Actibacterium pelagium]